MPLQSIATKRVLLLAAFDKEFFVCDEYTPQDGRVHILHETCYGLFDRDTLTLDYRKVSVDIASIVYEGDEWPDAIAGSKSITDILHHFGKA